ncbi:MAG: hypothetical protein IT359_01400 [Gemmatimonadaceae bacterium]|nr:hypothetical protein [Gemmatimonadaceae bacterium]
MKHDPNHCESTLLRNVLGAAAHDLGGLSSALALRSELFPMEQGAPLAAIARELRSLGQQLRAVRGVHDAEFAAPERVGALPTVFALLSRFGRAALGSGFALECRASDVAVTAPHAEAITFGFLSLLHAVRESDVARPSHVTIDAEWPTPEHPTQLRISLRLVTAEGAAVALPPDSSPWVAFAERTFTDAGLARVRPTNDAAGAGGTQAFVVAVPMRDAPRSSSRGT